MFGKKKNVVQKSSADLTVDRLWKELNEHFRNLRERVEDAYIKSLAIAVYPSGADKEKAKKDLEKAQELVLASIAHYDTVRNEYLNFLKNHREDLVIHAEVTGYAWEESHAIVESAIRNLVKR